LIKTEVLKKTKNSNGVNLFGAPSTSCTKFTESF